MAADALAMTPPDVAPVAYPTLGLRRVAGDPAGELATLAGLLMDLDASRTPAQWRTPSFARRVEVVRRHLRAASSRTVLALSFEREACRLGPATAAAAARTDAVRAAYAMRYAELEGGLALPSWSVWLDWRTLGQAGAPR